jgi:hypothetical protein
MRSVINSVKSDRRHGDIVRVFCVNKGKTARIPWRALRFPQGGFFNKLTNCRTSSAEDVFIR